MELNVTNEEMTKDKEYMRSVRSYECVVTRNDRTMKQSTKEIYEWFYIKLRDVF